MRATGLLCTKAPQATQGAQTSTGAAHICLPRSPRQTTCEASSRHPNPPTHLDSDFPSLQQLQSFCSAHARLFTQRALPSSADMYTAVLRLHAAAASVLWAAYAAARSSAGRLDDGVVQRGGLSRVPSGRSQAADLPALEAAPAHCCHLLARRSRAGAASWRAAGLCRRLQQRILRTQAAHP